MYSNYSKLQELDDSNFFTQSHVDWRPSVKQILVKNLYSFCYDLVGHVVKKSHSFLSDGENKSWILVQNAFQQQQN